MPREGMGLYKAKCGGLWVEGNLIADRSDNVHYIRKDCYDKETKTWYPWWSAIDPTTIGQYSGLPQDRSMGGHKEGGTEC